MTVVRFPWDEFPSVWIHAPELEVKKHFAYRAAKSGDPDAAYQLVNEMLSEQVVEQLASTFEGTQVTLVSAHAIENIGVNAIPEALANCLAQKLHWRADSSIVQTNIVAHTGADGFSPLARQAKFEGKVIPDKCYLLVDDFIGQGGTLANLRSHIIQGAGKVMGATVLTGKPYSANLALTETSLNALRLKHGCELEQWWQNRFGFNFDCLTESEARYLLKTPTIDRIRDRIAQTEQS
ncbi:phosphoribosyltransferase [Phormidium sp. CCY1219]|uniref:phosphoribosyltransferase n=1 Tax=Phormidium sp. CCY1219 TaxID=2886104 RepID=UPI002D1F55E5|nr:phosphoribosyltransferase [Phormidium sp. CCY1219]MEB3826373.1 phosphoribosyltransferase [Phormidium sp. CCY1219]